MNKFNPNLNEPEECNPIFSSLKKFLNKSKEVTLLQTSPQSLNSERELLISDDSVFKNKSPSPYHTLLSSGPELIIRADSLLQKQKPLTSVESPDHCFSQEKALQKFFFGNNGQNEVALLKQEIVEARSYINQLENQLINQENEKQLIYSQISEQSKTIRKELKEQSIGKSTNYEEEISVHKNLLKTLNSQSVDIILDFVEKIQIIRATTEIDVWLGIMLENDQKKMLSICEDNRMQTFLNFTLKELEVVNADGKNFTKNSNNYKCLFSELENMDACQIKEWFIKHLVSVKMDSFQNIKNIFQNNGKILCKKGATICDELSNLDLSVDGLHDQFIKEKLFEEINCLQKNLDYEKALKGLKSINEKDIHYEYFNQLIQNWCKIVYEPVFIHIFFLHGPFHSQPNKISVHKFISNLKNTKENYWEEVIDSIYFDLLYSNYTFSNLVGFGFPILKSIVKSFMWLQTSQKNYKYALEQSFQIMDSVLNKVSNITRKHVGKLLENSFVCDILQINVLIMLMMPPHETDTTQPCYVKNFLLNIIQNKNLHLLSEQFNLVLKYYATKQSSPREKEKAKLEEGSTNKISNTQMERLFYEIENLQLDKKALLEEIEKLKLEKNLLTNENRIKENRSEKMSSVSGNSCRQILMDTMQLQQEAENRNYLIQTEKDIKIDKLEEDKKKLKKLLAYKDEEISSYRNELEIIIHQISQMQ